MSLYRKYLNDYEEKYIYNSKKIRENNEMTGFFLLKEYIWIALEFLRENKVVEAKDTKSGKRVVGFDFETDAIKVTEILLELEHKKEYLMLDSILRFMDDLDKLNHNEIEEEDMFYCIGNRKGDATKMYYSALFALASLS